MPLQVKADTVGSAWTDERIREAFERRNRTAETQRECLSEDFEQALHRKAMEQNGHQLRGVSSGSNLLPAARTSKHFNAFSTQWRIGRNRYSHQQTRDISCLADKKCLVF